MTAEKPNRRGNAAARPVSVGRAVFVLLGVLADDLAEADLLADIQWGFLKQVQQQ